MKIDDYFRIWPFSVVPDRTEPLVWAGRTKLRKQLFSLLNSFNYRPQSTLDVVWAAFGSGKTHLMLYLDQESRKDIKIIPWYCIVPQNARSFMDMYRSLMSNFPTRTISRDIVNIVNTRTQEFEIGSVLQALFMGSQEQKSVASDWLKGFRVDLRSARKLLYIPYKLENTNQMQRVFIQVLKSIINSGIRVLLLLDEYQRVRAHQTFRESVNSTILDAFNLTPKGLSVVFSCSAVQQATALKIISPELIDRMRGRQIFCLPAFSEEEAIEFTIDLIKEFRPKEYAGNECAPFSRVVLTEAMKHIVSDKNLQLIPRHIIQVLDGALGIAVEEDTDNVEVDHIVASAEAMSASDTEYETL